MKNILWIWLLALTGLVSCTTTKYVEVPVVHTDTLYKSKVERDSIYLHDSTYIKETGDTVWVEKWHTRWRERMLTDTIYRSKVDSVAVPYPVEVEVERKLTAWQTLRMRLGETLLGLLAVLLVYGAFRLWMKYGKPW